MRFRRVSASMLDSVPSARIAWVRRQGNATTRTVRAFVERYAAGDLAGAGRYTRSDISFSAPEPGGGTIELVGLDAIAGWGRERRRRIDSAVNWRMLDVVAAEGIAALLFEERWGSASGEAHGYVAVYRVVGGRIASIRVHGLDDVPPAVRTDGSPGN